MIVASIFGRINLFVNPWVLNRFPTNEFLRLEPQSNLLLCRFNCIGAMADVTADGTA